jgi:GT2 family glycosyltransferase
MRVEPDTLGRLVGALDDAHPCAAAHVFSWDGRRIDFVRGTVNFEGRGFQEHYGERARPELLAAADTFFPNGGAFAVTRDAYEAIGGFDPSFFAYYDDVDLGWRLRLAGARITTAPGARVYHRHGATSRRYPRGQKRFLMERNALWTAIKNYEEPTLEHVLPVVLLLAARRIVQETRVARSSAIARALGGLSPACRSRLGPRLGRGTRADEVYRAEGGGETRHSGGEPAVQRMPIEVLAAVGSALDGLPGMATTRRRVQATRVVPDSALLSALGRGLEAT